MKPRKRAEPLAKLSKISDIDHERLRQGARSRTLTWGTEDKQWSKLVGQFRNEVKGYYFVAQNRRCCYCSFELQSHKLTYDAEHILDKDEYPEHTFELNNIAAICKHCNISKSNQGISASEKRFDGIPANSDSYSIVHPHYDEWEAYLRFDEIGRIVPVNNSLKGKETVRVCKIGVINATRLSDAFSIEDKPVVELALRTFHEVDDVAKKQELLDVVRELANEYRHSGAKIIVDYLEKEMAH